MIKDIKPLNVSPIIKTARWSLLFLGVLYGSRRQNKLKLYEARAGIERRKMLQERQKNIALDNERNIRRDIRGLYEIFGVSEIPPEFRDF